MLTVVPTPIGNLRDITMHALDVLREADFIACEDTRQTLKLLSYYEIPTMKEGVPRLLSFHEHSGAGQLEKILDRLADGKTAALVSDGGMPVVSDPGFDLLAAARERGIPVEVLPGPSSVLTALVASGLAVHTFSFHGFLPPKSAARKKILGRLETREETLIFFESPHRLIKSMEEMKEVLGDREAAVCRELTKKFEEIARGRLSEVLEHFKKKSILGEIVIVVQGKNQKALLARGRKE